MPAPEPRKIASLVFSIIAGIVSLGSVFGSCLMRRPRHDPTAIPFKSLFIFLLSQSIHIAVTVHWRVSHLEQVPPGYDEYYEEYYEEYYDEEHDKAMLIVAQICQYLQSILILNVLYRLIYAYKAQNRNETTKTILSSKVHGSTLVSLMILSLTHFITWVMSEFGYDEVYGRSTYGLQLACDGLVLIAALDIMFQIFTMIRNQNHANRSSMIGAPSLAVGGFFFFTLSLSLLVSDSMRQGTILPEKAKLPQEIVTAICITGQCIGIVHYCMQQHKLGIYGRRSPSSADDERAHMLPASNEEML